MSSAAVTDSLYKLDPKTRELLTESAPLMEEWSHQFCRSKNQGGMEEWAKTNQEAQQVQTCDWYHGTWQYLRLLNMVAVPPWYGFYNEALAGVLRKKPEAKVLISACADYGMLMTLHEAVQTADASPRIVIYDICETPLRSCQWYADRHGFEIEWVCGNLITGEVPEAPFDLIVTDEFLTVLKLEYKPQILERWEQLLKPGGTLVTTAMIGDATTPDLRQRYAQRARTLVESNGDCFPHSREGQARELIQRMERFAGYHTRHMLVDDTELSRLFSRFSDFSYSRIATPGECVNPTYSFQIVASLPE